MCVSSAGLAFAWGLRNGGNGVCPPSENSGSPWIEGDVGKEEVPFLVGEGSRVRQQGQDRGSLNLHPGVQNAMHCNRTDRLDSSIHLLTDSLLIIYYVPGPVLSSGDTLGKKSDLLTVFMKLKAWQYC